MGVSSKIFLHKNASTEKVFEVILKVTGNSFSNETFSLDKSASTVDFNNPPSEKNRWYLKPIENSSNFIKFSDTSYFQFNFCDLVDNRYYSNYHIENDEYQNTIDGMKMLYTTSATSWIAFGKRLVDFFGGEIIFSDTTEYEDRFENNNVYICENPKFNSSAFSSNEKFYSYYELLHKEKRITCEDLLWAKERAYYFGKRDKKLFDYVKKLEDFEEIKDSMQYREPSKSGKNKI